MGTKRTAWKKDNANFLLSFKTTCLFWIPRLFRTSVLSVSAYGGNGDTGAVREWASVGLSVYRGATLGQPWAFLHKFGLKGCHRPKMELCCSLLHCGVPNTPMLLCWTVQITRSFALVPPSSYSTYSDTLGCTGLTSGWRLEAGTS